MNTWILIVLMSSFSMTAGMHINRLPVGLTATFADRQACEDAGKATVKLAEQARLERPSVAFVCMPASGDAPK